MSESAAEPDAPADGETEEPEVFENRAARRSKGKKSAHAEVFSKGQPPAARGNVQGPRQYGTRRSG